MDSAAAPDTLAITGAIGPILIAVFTVLVALRRAPPPGFAWWAAALAVEALRLASGSRAGPSALIAEAGVALGAVFVLFGTFHFMGTGFRPVPAIAALAAGAVLIGVGLFEPGAAQAAILGATVAAMLATAGTAWLLWDLCRRTRGECEFLLFGLGVLATLYLLVHALDTLGLMPGLIDVARNRAADSHASILFALTVGLCLFSQQRRHETRGDNAQAAPGSEQRLRDFVEVASDWVWEMGPDLRFTYFSERVEQATGLPRESLIGHARAELLDGDLESPAWRAHLADLAARRAFRDFRYRIRRADGQVVHVCTSGKPIYGPDDAFLGYRGTGTNITAETTAQEHASRLDQRLRGALESLRHGIALFDADDRLVYCNSKHGTIYPQIADIMVPGHTFEELLRAAADRGLFPQSGDALESYVQERLAQHRGASGEAILQALNGGRWVQINETRTEDGGTFVSWTDITAVKRRERALAMLIESDPAKRSVFEIAAQALAQGLGYRWAGIARLEDAEHAQVLAYWADGALGESFQYDLRGTPCEGVARSSTYCYYPERVAEVFPQDRMLADMGAVSYQGEVFTDDRATVIGHIFALHDRPISAEPWHREFVGLIARWVGLAFQQQRAKADLRESERRFKDLAESASDWFWEMDRDLRFTFVSDRIAENAGIPAGYLVGKTRRELLEGGDPVMDESCGPDHWNAHLADLEAHRPFRNFIHPRILADGQKVHLLLSGTPVFDEDGAFTGYRGSARNVTERIRAETDLRNSRALLDAVVNAVPAIVNAKDLDSRYVLMNRFQADLYGVSPEGAIGQTAAELLGREYGSYTRDLDRQVLESGEALPYFEEEFADVRGIRRAWLTTKVPLKTDRGQVSNIVTVSLDITKRRRAERALRESEARLKRAQHQAKIGYWRWSFVENQLTYWSDEAARICGLEANDLGVRFEQMMQRVHPEDRQRVLEEYLAADRDRRDFQINYRVLLENGEIYHIHEIGEVEFDEAGVPIGHVGTVQDVTILKRAEEMERQRTAFVELSRVVAAAANEAIGVEDALQVCLDQVCQHTGWPVGHAYLLKNETEPNLEPTGVWHLDDPARFEAFRRATMETTFGPGKGLPGRVLASGKPEWTADIRKAPRGSCPRLAKGAGEIGAGIGFPVTVGQRVVGVLEFFSDRPTEPDRITLEVMAQVGNQLGRVIERTRTRAQLLAAKEAAEKANRAKGEFLATMSHELRTPLNAVIGFSEIMASELFGPVGQPVYKDYAKDILQSGTHLLNIINDILDVSKAEAGKVDLSDDIVDFSELIRSALRLVRERANEKGLALVVEAPERPVHFRGDRRRLTQVLLNLLSNAVKFTSVGHVLVRLYAPDGTGVTLEIVDTGIGIAEHDLDRVMEPFAQADSGLSRTHEGTGLGLPLSRALVEMHGGALTIESVFRRGTVVTVRLPGDRLLGATDAA